MYMYIHVYYVTCIHVHLHKLHISIFNLLINIHVCISKFGTVYNYHDMYQMI